MYPHPSPHAFIIAYLADNTFNSNFRFYCSISVFSQLGLYPLVQIDANEETTPRKLLMIKPHTLHFFFTYWSRTQTLSLYTEKGIANYIIGIRINLVIKRLQNAISLICKKWLQNAEYMGIMLFINIANAVFFLNCFLHRN